MIIKLNINDRAALAMKNGTKKIEIRVGANYDKLNYGDIIEFSSNNLGKFYVKVEGINHYNSLDELFTLEGTRYTVSSTNDKKEAILNVEKIGDYKNIIKENGVYAIHIKYLYSENIVWEGLYYKAKNIRDDREVSGMISAGCVGAAILTKGHNIYTGVCIDTASSLGMCAERNAIANMITNGEDSIKRVIAIDRDGKAIPPCGACREFMTQLMPEGYRSIEIMMDYENERIVTLGDLTPEWWI